MTLFNPIWDVTINGVHYTEFVLANLSIQSGRTNIYEQAQADPEMRDLRKMNTKDLGNGRTEVS